MFESLLDLDAGETMAFLGEQRRIADQAEARLLAAVAHWADLHPLESLPYGTTTRASGDGRDRAVPLAGEGTPEVAEFAIADLATTLGLSDSAARGLLGDALELRHRLPRVWARVVDGTLQTWRARRIAQRTRGLRREAAGRVDPDVAPLAHRVGPGKIQDLVEAAAMRVDPEAAEESRASASQMRAVTVYPITPEGTATVICELDGPDAKAFDHAVAHLAAVQAALGDDSPLDVRRAKAVGLLADPAQALALMSEVPDRLPLARREVVLYVHTSDLAVIGGRGIARPEGLSPLVLSTIRAWCHEATNVRVRPVLDLHTEIGSESYVPSTRLREQVMVRDRQCVFPWCGRQSRNHDLDHIIEYDAAATRDPAAARAGDAPQQTTSSNLARLCRYHHRLKTHTSWSYRRDPDDGSYLWTSPYGEQWRVTRHGTESLLPPIIEVEPGLGDPTISAILDKMVAAAA